MRKPRDIGEELKALSAKAKDLKAKRVVQLGELVTLTGADVLDLETLAGALLAVAENAKQPGTKEAWRNEGVAFFQRRRRPKSGPDPAGQNEEDVRSAEAGDGGSKAD